MTSTAKSPYAGYRFPGEVISHAVWLYFRFPLSLRMVEEMLAARGIEVSHEGTVNLIGSGRDKAGEAGHTNAYARAYARAATPVTAAQVWKAWVRAARYWTAGR